MVDVLRHLPPAQFGGIQFPVTSRTFRIAQENAPHKIQYANGVFFEQKGSDAPTWSYEVPARDGVAVGPYHQFFTSTLQSLLDAFLLRQPQTLLDPVWGAFRAAPSEWEDVLSSGRGRDGVDLSISFVHKPLLEEEFQPEQFSVDGLVGEAARIDEEVERINWQQQDPPEPTIDPLSAAAGLIRQVEFEVSQYLDRLERYIAKTEDVLKAAERHEDPAQTYQLRRRTRRAIHAAQKAKKLVTDPLKPLRNYLVDAITTVDQLAAQLGTDVKDLIEKNPFLARNGGNVFPGTQVFYTDG